MPRRDIPHPLAMFNVEPGSQEAEDLAVKLAAKYGIDPAKSGVSLTAPQVASARERSGIPPGGLVDAPAPGLVDQLKPYLPYLALVALVWLVWRRR